MKARKLFVWLIMTAALVSISVGAAGCQSTGESYTGSDGHAGHNH